VSRIARLLRPKAALHPPFWSQPELGFPWGGGERPDIDIPSVIAEVYKKNGPVWACILVRALVFSEARFMWQRFSDEGRPAGLFDNDDLKVLETPWQRGTTGELLIRMEQDASLAGNSWWTRRGLSDAQRLERLRPEWVKLIIDTPIVGEPNHPDARLVGIAYMPPTGAFELKFNLTEVVHYSPIPDPEQRFVGMSWLSPVLEEVYADKAATRHKTNFFKRGAVLGTAVSYDAAVSPDEFDAFVERFRQQHEGTENAWRTLHLGGGADAKVIGTDFQQLDLARVIGRGETRIAMAAGVHPVIAGMAEGLQGSALNAGNYAQVRRRFVDGTIRPLWRIAAASLQQVFKVPSDARRLWYDDRDIPFLRDDAKQEADIRKVQAETIAKLVHDGFTPESAVDAVITGDFKRLEHSGLLSVQLQTTPAKEAQPE
jgi:phage portal protein BeeE